MNIQRLTFCVLVTVLSLGVSMESTIGSEKVRIILDTDANNELDDQHAIAYLLFNGDRFEVEGITVNQTSGGGDIDKHVEEAERVVTLCSLASAVKVIPGASGKYERLAAVQLFAGGTGGTPARARRTSR